MYKLVCESDPKALGIEAADGSWDIRKLGEHIKTCPVCGAYFNEIKNGLEEDFDNMVMAQKVSDISAKAWEKFHGELDEGIAALRSLSETGQKRIIQFLTNLMLQEVRDVLDGNKDVADAPFAAEIDSYYEELKPKGCYFCDHDIDGNSVPFNYPQTRLCLSCQLKVANLLKYFNIDHEILFPGMGERTHQPVRWKRVEDIAKEEGVRH